MPTDQELIARLADREEEAFDLLLQRYAEVVLRRATGILRDRVSADDVLQETFLRIWTSRERLRGGSVLSWLLTTATNLALNRLRSRKRRDRHLDRAADPERAPAPPTAGRCTLEGAERREAVRRAVRGLTPAKREVVRLVHEERMELRRVAEELGVPLGTVKSRLHHARRDLARMLDEMEWEEWS